MTAKTKVKDRFPQLGWLLLVPMAAVFFLTSSRAQDHPVEPTLTPVASQNDPRVGVPAARLTVPPQVRLSGVWSMRVVSHDVLSPDGKRHDSVDKGHMVILFDGNARQSGYFFYENNPIARPFAIRVMDHNGELLVDLIDIEDNDTKRLGIAEISDDNSRVQMAFQYPPDGSLGARPRTLKPESNSVGFVSMTLKRLGSPRRSHSDASANLPDKYQAPQTLPPPVPGADDVTPTAGTLDSLSPDSTAVANLLPNLLAVLRHPDCTDPNAIPISSAGVTIYGGKACGTPKVNDQAIPAGYKLLPLEFMLDRGHVAAINAGDRVTCTFDDGNGNENPWIADATVLTVSRPFAKDGNHLATEPGPKNPATHRVFTLLVTKEAHKRFWDVYDLDRATSGRQIAVLSRHADSSRR